MGNQRLDHLLSKDDASFRKIRNFPAQVSLFSFERLKIVLSNMMIGSIRLRIVFIVEMGL